MSVWLAVALLSISQSLKAEQLSLVIAPPEFSASNDASKNPPTNSIALWQSLLTGELSKQSSFALLDREDLPRLAEELALVAGQKPVGSRPAPRPGWLGADCLVLTKWQLHNGTNQLAIKILDVGQGGIEKELTQSFAENQMDTAVQGLAGELRTFSLELLSRRQIHTVISVLDFESQSRFDRGQWQEHALARQLRAFLKQQPGVLVLEREDVEELLRETRLQRGGLAAAGTALTNLWAALRHYPLVSGTIIETQPEGAPMTLRITIHIQDLGDGWTNGFSELFSVGQWAPGVEKIEQHLNQVLRGGGSRAAGNAPGPDRSTEAMALAERALRLSTWPEIATYKGLVQRIPHGLLDYNERERMFAQRESGQRIVSAHTLWRRAQIMQACQYLKASILADDRNPQIKLLLASLLADSQVNEPDLAVELAEEVGWQFPEHRLAAWSQAYNCATGPQKERFLHLLIQYFPDSDFARIPTQREFEAFIQKHRSDHDLTALLDRLRPELDRVIAENRAGINLEGDMERLFEFTQITGINPSAPGEKPALQTPENQARGVALLEEMIQKHPAQAFFLCHFWSKCWDDYSPDDPKAWDWFRRAAEVTPSGTLTKFGNNNYWDHRLKLVQRLMDHHEFKEALYYLGKINQQDLLEGDRDMLLARCAYELGDYQQTLDICRAKGSDNQEATELATKCERKLNQPPVVAPVKNYPYAVDTNQCAWRVIPLSLPAHAKIHATAADAENLWLGLIPPELERDAFLPQLQGVSNPAREQQLREFQARIEQRLADTGGLLCWNRASGKAHLLTTATGLPHSWVWSLAVTPEGLWVGSSGGGLALLDASTRQWTTWTETNGLPMNYVRCLAADDKNLWVGMGYLNRGAVARLSLRSREWREFLPSDYPDKTNYPSPHILAMSLPDYMKHPVVISYVPITPVSALEVIDGRLWCVLPGAQSEGCIWSSSASHPQMVKEVRANFEPHGTVVFDRPDNKWNLACDDAPTSMARVKDRIWFALGGAGLANCDLKGGNWQRITQADGLPFAPGLICEWEGLLLIAGEQFMVLDPEKKQFVIYPFPTPGAAALMAKAGNSLYLIRGSEILTLDLNTLSTNRIPATSASGTSTEKKKSHD